MYKFKDRFTNDSMYERWERNRVIIEDVPSFGDDLIPIYLKRLGVDYPENRYQGQEQFTYHSFDSQLNMQPLQEFFCCYERKTPSRKAKGV